MAPRKLDRHWLDPSLGCRRDVKDGEDRPDGGFHSRECARHPRGLGPVRHQLVQVLLVGLAIGMMRTAVPALAETELGVGLRLFGESFTS